MPYLFRAYSAQSQGINTPTLFAPAAATTTTNHLPLTTYTPPPLSSQNLGPTLQKALAWNKSISSPFTFWTASLLFAVQVARSRQKKGEDNVQITALEVESVKTLAGKKGTFTSVATMLGECGIRLERANGEEKDYREVFVSMDVLVVPAGGAGSRTVGLEGLEGRGLYRLYPGLECGFERDDGRTRLNRRTEGLRGWHFWGEQGLTVGRLGIAVGLAAMFVPAGGEGKGEVEDVDVDILAHLLAFRKRSVGDPVLLQWIDKSTAKVVQLDGDDKQEEDALLETMLQAVDLEEVKQFFELQKLFKNRMIPSPALDLTATGGVGQSEIDAELADWKRWEYQQRQEFRAKKEARPDYDPNFKRRDPRLSECSSDSPSDSSTRDAAYAARRASRPWVPREQCIEQRDAYRTQKGRREYHANTTTASERVWQPSGVDKTKRYGRADSRRIR